MSDAEIAAFLEEERTVICATIGRDGFAHLMPLWYVMRGDEVWSWTFAKSQKVRNLEREPRATLQVEAGEEYQELRGVMFECDVELERDPGRVERFGIELFERFVPEITDDIRAMIGKQAPKRVGLTFVPTRTVTWDHRKLGGVY